MSASNSQTAAAVYVQSNDARTNEVLAFERLDDGRLAPLGRFATSGRGTGMSHLPSQSSIVLDDDGRQLLVVNAGSDELLLFAVSGDGLRLSDCVGTGASGRSEHPGWSNRRRRAPESTRPRTANRPRM
jgi:6-phosphogluconolactonase (cycloisomerase 2 family)